MTMYLPNSDLQPTGAEVAEFLDVPPMPETLSSADARVERRDRTGGGDAGPDLDGEA
jgi:hypothetical protein